MLFRPDIWEWQRTWIFCRTSMIFFRPQRSGRKNTPPQKCAGRNKIIPGKRGAKKDPPEDLFSHLNDFFVSLKSIKCFKALERKLKRRWRNNIFSNPSGVKCFVEHQKTVLEPGGVVSNLKPIIWHGWSLWEAVNRSKQSGGDKTLWRKKECAQMNVVSKLNNVFRPAAAEQMKSTRGVRRFSP